MPRLDTPNPHLIPLAPNFWRAFWIFALDLWMQTSVSQRTESLTKRLWSEAHTNCGLGAASDRTLRAAPMKCQLCTFSISCSATEWHGSNCKWPATMLIEPMRSLFAKQIHQTPWSLKLANLSALSEEQYPHDRGSTLSAWDGEAWVRAHAQNIQTQMYDMYDMYKADVLRQIHDWWCACIDFPIRNLLQCTTN